MCGIALVIGPKDYSAILSSMLQSQKHRGPDYTGTFIDLGYAAIGHNRLAIIDLTEAGNQPFIDPSGRYILSFNGEIYNYKELKVELKNSYSFITQTDTEVLLAAYLEWGSACLNKLKGMFSFAIWDTKNKELFGARDRFGVKPLYYAFLNSETLLIASEIKALHQAGVPKVANKKVWGSYFAHGSYGAPDETFWQGIHQLRGGHFLNFRESEGCPTITRWFNFKKLVGQQPSDLSFEEATTYYSNLLEASIKLRFRADVPVGFNLSGGLDSSTLLHLVSKYYPKDRDKCKAFTFYTGDDRYDELFWVELMLQSSQIDLEKIKLTADEVPPRAQRLADLQDEPYGGVPTIAYAKLFERARSQGVLVLLDGQGMDEQWAGYDYYHTQSSSSIQGVTKSPFRPEVLNPNLFANVTRLEIPKVFENTMQQKQYRDLFYTKIPRALRFNDRVSMASSVELREPFLDEGLVAFAFAQPEAFKITKGQTKYLVRQYVNQSLTEEVALAPKRPLQTPQREWLGEELAGFVQEQLDRLLSGNLSELFQADEVMNVLKSYKEGDRDSSFHIWQLVNAGLTS